MRFRTPLESVCHNGQSARLISEFGFGRILLYAPGNLIHSA